MKRQLIPLVLSGLLLGSCGGKKDASTANGDDFDRIGDEGRVARVMRTQTPDSLARFIIYGALGRDKSARIDTLAIATAYAYSNLKDDAVESFAVEYDKIVDALPLQDKMRLYVMAGTEDPQGLGYKLGLEYLSSVRDGHKSVADIERELSEFKKACGADTVTYRRFLVGFHTVLKMDHGTDVPEDVYNRFIDYK